jgi:hypothetical protein
MKKIYSLVFLASLITGIAQAQTNYYSKSGVTNFNDVNSWGTNTDGTGTAPSSISNADIFNIRNTSQMVLTANADVKGLIIGTSSAGKLTVNGGFTITVAAAAGNTSICAVDASGTLDVASTGTLIVKGSMFFANGAACNQTGGLISVDGNDGGAAATSTSLTIFGIGYSISGGASSISSVANANKFVFSNGILRIVDPSTVVATATPAFAYRGASSVPLNFGVNHTTEFGDGTSTDAGGNSAGFQHHVFISSARLQYGNLTINLPAGTNRIVTSGTTTYGILGNLNISSGSTFRASTSDGLGTLHVRGNIQNEGTFVVNSSLYLADYTGSSAANATSAQTISGSGTFQNLITSPTANFHSIIFQNSNNTGITFSGTGWQSSPSTVSNTLTFNSTTGTLNRVNIGASNTFTLGVNTSTLGTLNTGTGGFTEGTFKRWLGTAAISVGAALGTFPFVSPNGATANFNRNFFIGNTTLTTGGTFSVKYTHGVGTNAVTAFADNGANIAYVSNAKWEVSQSSITPSTATLQLRNRGDGITIIGNVANSRMTDATAPIFTAATSGTGSGTATNPEANKTTTTFADVTSAPTAVYFGTPFVYQTVASGTWDNTSTWLAGLKPGACDDATIVTGHTVTLNTAETVNNLTINTGATLTQSAGSLVVGCANKNNLLSNAGTLNVNGGTLTVNGRMAIVAASTFAQTAGNIMVDGNDAGIAATSVASGSAIVSFLSNLLTLSGGTFTIVDPHANTTATNTFEFNTSLGHVNASPAHTMQFGDGVSTDAGGNVVGFRYNLRAGSSGLALGNLVIQGGAGTNRFVTQNGSNHGVIGNFTVKANGEYRINSNSNNLHVNGNVLVEDNGIFTADGYLNMQNYLSVVSSPSTNAQTITCQSLGIIRNSVSSATGNFYALVINNANAAGVTIGDMNDIGTAPTYPANIAIVNTFLVFNSGTLATAPGVSLITGTAAGGTTAATLSVTSGGMKAGSSYGRFWTAAQTGTSFSGTSDPSSTTSRFPFVNSLGENRSFWIKRNTPSAAGILAVTYTDANTISTVSVTDGAYTIDRQFDGNWTVTNLGTSEAATTYDAWAVAPTVYTTTTTNNRLYNQNPVIATHLTGTVTPGAGRGVMTYAQLTTAPLYMGINVNDLGFTSKQSGNWNDPNTWVKGTVPASCSGPGDDVIISGGHTVTVNSASCAAKSLNARTTSSLVIASGDLQVGCTHNNNTFTLDGSLSVTGGDLKVNGNLAASNNSTFSQSGGNISIDGNANGVIANSVASSTPIVSFIANKANALSFTGGNFSILDPHAATTSTNALFYNGTSAATINVTDGHTFTFGNGAATQDGGNAAGFTVNTWPGSTVFCFGNLVINSTNTGTNKSFSYDGGPLLVRKNFTVNANSTVSQSTSRQLIVGGNVENNGTLRTNGVYFLSNFNLTTSGWNLTPATVAQTIGGSGTFSNAIVSPTAEVVSIEVNNSNASGVTLNVPLRLSGTLTMTSGIINTTPTNILTLGYNAANTGVLTYTAGWINGPLKRWIGTSAGSRTFPVGNTTHLKNAVINFTGAPTAGGTLTAQWSSSSPSFPNASPLMEGAILIDDAHDGGSWKIDAADGLTGGTYTATLTANGTTPLVDFANTVLIKRPSAGGDWVLDGTHVTTTGSVSAPVLSRTGMSGFSEFGIGGTGAVLNTNLRSFNAVKTGNTASINWQVANSSLLQSFEVLESADGRNYNSLANVNAVSGQSNYGTVDNNLVQGANYYKLKLVATNGTISYSNVAIVYHNQKGFEVTMLPTLVFNTATVQISTSQAAKGQLSIVDMMGRTVKSSAIQLLAGSQNLNMDLTNLAAGTYQMVVNLTDGERKLVRFVKQ